MWCHVTVWIDPCRNHIRAVLFHGLSFMTVQHPGWTGQKYLPEGGEVMSTRMYGNVCPCELNVYAAVMGKCLHSMMWVIHFFALMKWYLYLYDVQVKVALLSFTAVLLKCPKLSQTVSNAFNFYTIFYIWNSFQLSIKQIQCMPLRP